MAGNEKLITEEQTNIERVKARQLFSIIDSDDIDHKCSESFTAFYRKIHTILYQYLISQDEIVNLKLKTNTGTLSSINNSLSNIIRWYRSTNPAIQQHYKSRIFQIGEYQFSSDIREITTFLESLIKVNDQYTDNVLSRNEILKEYIKSLNFDDNHELRTNLCSLFVSYYSSEEILDDSPTSTYSNIFLDSMEDFVISFFELFFDKSYQRTPTDKNESHKSATRQYILGYLKEHLPK